MFKGNITAGAVTANTYIPITQVFNTNRKVRLNNNQVEILRGGLWDIEAVVNYTASGASTVANLMINGNAVQTVTRTTADGSNFQLIFNDAEIVRDTFTDDVVRVGIQFANAVTILGGEIIVKYES